jgi:dTDP-4-dehydrorhamnose 3,5-epimerase
MHFQPGMAKLVRCSRGAIFDVIVDLPVGSPTFGEWEGVELSDANHHVLYCPDGFAHRFFVLSEEADVIYKKSTYYAPERGRVRLRRCGGWRFGGRRISS